MLVPGDRLGPYEIIAPLGAGGMGEVYRARDARLDRTVAVKILPPHLALNPDLRQRFEREAHIIAQVSHPHICAIFDVGHRDDLAYLVIEYLEGETLAARLARGSLPTEQLLRYSVEMADALDQAHRQGVVHRDVKPGNIMITKSGAMLLDFGLAKLREIEMPVTAISRAWDETTRTVEGTLIGTFQYMAPEQLDGREADARTDIFALGAVLYEMATGRRAFEGKTQAALIGAILNQDPPPISASHPVRPPALEHIIRRCLAKDPDERWQSARDLAGELRWLAHTDSQAGSSMVVVARPSGRVPWIAVGALSLTLAAIAPFVVRHVRENPAPETRTLRLAVLPPDRSNVEAVTVSPDGRYLAFAASGADGRTLLWLRSIDNPAMRPLAGTDSADFPFWSPDNRYIGFFAEAKLKRIAIAGGPAEVLCDAANPRGGTWSDDGVILFAPSSGGGLFRVPATGGTPTPLTMLDASRHESSHRWPSFLPGSHRFLYVIRSGLPEHSGVYLGSLDSTDRRRVLNTATNTVFAPEGFLLFVRDTTLLAQPFDLLRLQTTGDAVPLAEHVAYDGGSFRTDFAVSTTGLLTYRTGGPGNMQLVWFDRTGRQLSAIGAPGAYFNLTMSPDQRRVAVSRTDAERRDVWLFDVATGASSRFTFDMSTNLTPLWSPDGARLVFGSDRAGPYNLYVKAASGLGSDTLLLKSTNPKYVTDWSRDGRTIVYDAVDPATKFDIWMLPVSAGDDVRPTAFLQTPFDEWHGHLSPDGRWMAYTSNESGRYEVYVQSVPRQGGKWQISAGGGAHPAWSADGNEIFYIAPDRKLMAATVRASQAFEAGVPAPLFDTRVRSVVDFVNPYVVSRDGQRFLVTSKSLESSSAPVPLVVNWAAPLMR